MTQTPSTFTLPPSVVSTVDVARLVAELERVDNELTTAAVHEKVADNHYTQPVLSQQLNDFLQQNTIDLADGQYRSELVRQLRALKKSLPVVHMTFAASIDKESLQRLVEWVRTSLHPQAVIAIGLQPALIGGVYVRTTNKVYDLSLRSILKGQRGELVKQLEALHVER